MPTLQKPLSAGLLSLCLVMLTVSTAGAHATDVAPAGCKPVYFAPLDALDTTAQIDEFRIHYTLHGKNALPDPTDSDSNGRPDLIDDMALQLTTARSLYSQVFGLRHPLEQPRYAGAKYINIFVLALESGNGVAFDEVVNERLRQQSTDCALRIFVSNHVRPSLNPTPAHELFHLYQYGYSMFKSRWYLEGLARWVESAFRDSSTVVRASARALPLTCDDVYASSYAASTYWAQLGMSSGAGETSTPDFLRTRRYADGRSVLDKTQFQRGKFLLHALQGLESASRAAAVAQNLPRYRWSENMQRSNRFDKLICDTVEKVARTMRSQ